MYTFQHSTYRYYFCFIMQRNQQIQCKQYSTVSVSISIFVSSSKTIFHPLLCFGRCFLFLRILVLTLRLSSFVLFCFFLCECVCVFFNFVCLLILLLCVYFNGFQHQTLLSKLLDSIFCSLFLFHFALSLLFLVRFEYMHNIMIQFCFFIQDNDTNLFVTSLKKMLNSTKIHFIQISCE